MLFNGHTCESVDQIDEETFAGICVMYGDGLLGGKGIFDAIAPLTAAIFNYLREKGAPAYKATEIFPWVSEYDKNPDLDIPDADKINNALITFMTSAPGFNMGVINGGNK